MSRLLKIIDTYKDTHGAPSDSSIARALGVAPQTVANWRSRGFRQLPERNTLIALAKLTNSDYRGVIIPAALHDVGYVPLEEPAAEEPDAAGRSAV